MFLLIDDKKDNLVSLSALIKNFYPGCRIITALSGIKGIELALSGEPDIIILDLQMPHMDGFMVCEELKKETKTKHIPLIMLTARFVQKEDRIKGLGLGAISFLTKPIDDGDLFAQLKVALRIRKAEDKLRENIDQLEVSVDEKSVQAKESEKKFQFLLENASVGIGITAKNGKVFYANETMCRITGYSSDEIKKVNLADTYVNPDDSKKIFKIISKDGFVENFELEFYNKKKKMYWASFSIKQIMFDNLDAFLTVLIDITDRKQAEQSLKKAEAELKHTIEVVPGIIAKANAHTGYFTECNPALSTILGFSSKEFLVRPFIEFIHPDDRQSTIDEVEKQLKGIPVARFENRYICKDGSYKWLEWRATAADKKGIVYAAAIDVTVRKQAEEALRENEKRYKELIEKAGIAILIDNREGNFTYFNETFSELFGYSVEETKELSIQKLVHPEDVDWVMKMHKERIKAKKTLSRYEFRGIRKDGSVVHLEADIAGVIEGKSIIGTRSYIWDISKRRQAEQTLKKKMNDLERFNRLTVNRELKMIELKQEVNDLRNKAGLEKKYTITG